MSSWKVSEFCEDAKISLLRAEARDAGLKVSTPYNLFNITAVINFFSTWRSMISTK
jgi:hypothetical protein